MKLVLEAWEAHQRRAKWDEGDEIDPQKAFYAGVAAVTASLRQFLLLPRDETRQILGEERLFEAVSRSCGQVLAEIEATYPPEVPPTPENPLGLVVRDADEGEMDDFDRPQRGQVIFQSVKTGGSPGIMTGKPL